MSARLDDSLTKVLLAVLAIDRPTVKSCAERTGLAPSTVHDRLHKLRDMGLIAFDDYKRGTLRPLVRTVNAAG